MSEVLIGVILCRVTHLAGLSIHLNQRILGPSPWRNAVILQDEVPVVILIEGSHAQSAIGSPEKSLWEAGNLLLQKTPAENFKATTKIRFASKEDDQYGGIIMMGMNYQALVVRRMGDKFLLQQLYCKNADQGGIETEKTLATFKPTEKDTIPYSPAIYLDIYLQMKVKAGKCQFAYSLDGKRYKDAGDLFTLRQGKWIGAKMGFVSERKNTLGNRGWIDADWFRVTR